MFLCELFNNSFNFVAIVRKHCLKINLSVSLSKAVLNLKKTELFNLLLE